MTEPVDYKDDAQAYEIEEHSRPDEMMMLKVAGDIACAVLHRKTNASVLDLCCGTGLSLQGIVDHPNLAYVVGVDISANYLAFAKAKHSATTVPVHFVLGDAVSTPLPRDEWDLIMLASAYHHIEDDRKLTFLRRVRSLLGSSGHAIMAENVLPDYAIGELEAYRAAVRRFYDLVLETARAEHPGLPPSVEALIERVAQYGFDGDYEYKVCMKILEHHLREAGLRIVEKTRVWPDDDRMLGPDAGNFVLHLRSQLPRPAQPASTDGEFKHVRTN